jgi:hypothetical protein
MSHQRFLLKEIQEAVVEAVVLVALAARSWAAPEQILQLLVLIWHMLAVEAMVAAALAV